MSAHTRGPWEAIETRVYFPNLLGGFDIRKCPNAEANARLIAAAPDLLVQLSALLAMCERQTDFNDDGDGAMFERARAAIAKATGEQA